VCVCVFYACGWGELCGSCPSAEPGTRVWCVLVRSVYVCRRGNGSGTCVSVSRGRGVNVWKCLGCVVRAAGAVWVRGKAKWKRMRVGSVSVSAWLRVQECCEGGARLGRGRVCPGPKGTAVCVCVCVMLPAGTSCRGGAPQRLGPAIRKGGREGDTPSAAADSDMSGCLLFRKFCGRGREADPRRRRAAGAARGGERGGRSRPGCGVGAGSGLAHGRGTATPR
jgi:hypothetical protein